MASQLILFIGVVLATALVVSSLSLVFSRFEYSARQRALLEEKKAGTEVSIVEGGGTTSSIWIYVRNVGQVEVEVNGLAVFVDDRFTGTCEALSCRELGFVDGYLSPGELLEINISGSFSQGVHKVSINPPVGRGDEITVVIE